MNKIETQNGESQPDLARDDKRAAREKFEAQKRALQRLLVLTIERGCDAGLDEREVQAVREGLVVLGWLPTDLKVAEHQGKV